MAYLTWDWGTPAGTFGAEFYTAHHSHGKALEASQDSVSTKEFTVQNILKGYFKRCLQRQKCYERERDCSEPVNIDLSSLKLKQEGSCVTWVCFCFLENDGQGGELLG